MKRLWAPWRMAYIVEEKSEGCVLCKIAAAREDQKNGVLYRGEKAFVVLNAYPYNNGHLMVAPYSHVDCISRLERQEKVELMELTGKSIERLRKAFSPQGFNVGINIGEVAGAGIADHVHIHILPRWLGDTNFMTSVAETRVIPQMIENTFAVLAPFFLEMS